MASSRGVSVGYAVPLVACRGIRIFYARWPPVLVARRPASVERARMASVVHTVVPFRGYVALRHSFCISSILRPSCVPVLFVLASTLQSFSSARSAVCRCTHVGRCDLCLLAASDGHNDTDTLTPRSTFAAPRARHVPQTGAALVVIVITQFSRGGRISVATCSAA